MDRRKFLERFVKASGVSLAVGVCVACPAPGPRQLLRHGISYKDLDGIFKSHSCKVIFPKDDIQGVPISTKQISLGTDYVLDISNNIKQVENNLKIYNIKNGKKEYLSFKVLKVYDPTDLNEDSEIYIELKESLSYNTVYTIEASKDILSDGSWSDIEPGSNENCFRTTALELSTEVITIKEGDTKLVEIIKAYYKNRTYNNFEHIAIKPINISVEKAIEFLQVEADGNNLVIEAKKRGSILLIIIATVKDGEQTINFANKLYVNIN